MKELFPEGPSPQSPAELYMAFGPHDRVVKVRQGAALFLAHVARGADKLWRQDCEPRLYVEDADGSSLYQALRDLVDHCPALVELEP